jgi:hypothetical protein
MTTTLEKEKTQKTPMSPEIYFGHLKTIHLNSINLLDCSAMCKLSDADRVKLVLEIDNQSTFDRREERYAFLRMKHSLLGRVGKATVVKFRAQYEIVLESHTEIPDDFFEIYADVNLSMQTIPFFREWVATTSARMAIRPIIIPLFVTQTLDSKREP